MNVEPVVASALNGIGDGVPFSAYQRRIWNAHLATGNNSYLVPIAFDLIGGNCNLERLIFALSAVVRANDILNSTVLAGPDGPRLGTTSDPIKPRDLGWVEDLDCEVRRLLAEHSPPGVGDRLTSVTLVRSGEVIRVIILFHHVVIDGVSVDLFIEDVIEAYGDLDRFQVAPRPQYHELDPTPSTESGQWWVEHLQTEGGQGWTCLGANRASSTAVDRAIVLAPTLPAIAEAARRYGVKPVALWVTAVATALSRMLGTTSLGLAIPFANRSDLDDFETIGPFATTLPLFVTVPPKLPARELLTNVNFAIEELQRHGDVDLDDVTARLRNEGLRIAPWTDIFLNFQEAQRAELILDGTIVRPVAAHSGDGKGALTVSLQVGVNGADCQIESAMRDWDVDAHTGLRMAVASVIETLLDCPETLTDQIELGHVSAPDIKAQLPADTLIDSLRRHARDNPQRVAVTAPDTSLTWAALADGMDERAAILVKLGVSRGDSVLLAVDRDSLFVSWAAAIMSIGAAYVPVDLQQGNDRLRSIVAACGARVIVGGEPEGPIKQDHFPKIDGVQIVARGAKGAKRHRGKTAPEDVAYVLFTSGTTGTPKGVAVTHANIVGLVGSTDHLLSADTVTSCIHAFSFDYSVWEVWCQLFFGGRVVIATTETTKDPFRLSVLVCDEQVSVLSLTNTTLGALLTAMQASPDATGAIARSVRRVILGGEKVSPKLVAQFLDHFGDKIDMVNMLGATETTVHTTQQRISPDDGLGEMVPVGQALKSLGVTVVNPLGQPVPIGKLGEIAVRGQGLSLGYLKQPKLTAARFAPDPFPDAVPGSRLFFTGDLGRWQTSADGPILECHGRADSQVKVKGHRIELAGVERVLDSSPEVVQSCVIVHDDSLEAYVLLREDDTRGLDQRLEAIRKHARPYLAQYEMPGSVRQVLDFPRTITEKLWRDRKALLEQVPPNGETPICGGRAPGNTAASQFHVLLTEVLSRDEIDTTTTFMANGGDSIRAVQLVGQLRHHGYASIEVADLLSAHPLSELLGRVGSPTDTRGPRHERVTPFSMVDPTVKSALPADIADAYPLSAAQEGMMFHIMLDEEVGVYHNTASVRIRGVIDPVAFNVALTDTIARHEILRTSVEGEVSIEPVQLVHRHVPTPLRFVDARGEEGTVDDLLRELVEAERVTPFDLGQPPLFRVTLVRVGDDETQFIASDSHVILDGWSWTSTLTEIFERHNALLEKSADYDNTLTGETRSRFADYIATERDARQDPEAQRAWLEHLRGVPVRSIADTRGARGRNVQRTAIGITADQDADIRRSARESGVSPRNLMMAVHFRAIGEVLGATDLISGITSNGRLEQDGGVDVRGMFLNMLPYRQRVAGTLPELAQACAASEAQMSPYRRMPGVDIQQLIGRGTLFDYGFNYVQFHRLAEMEHTHTFGTPNDPHYSREDTDLALMATFSVHPPEHRLGLLLIADIARVSSQRVHDLSRAYAHFLAQAARASEG